MIDLPYAKIDARSPAGQSQWQIELLRGGKRLLAELVERHDIECGWDETGHYKAATTEFGIGQLKAIEAILDENRIPFRRLDAREIKNELGSAHYKKAIWLQNCTLVQPAELLTGLIDSLPGNVKIFFDTPVTAISRSSPYSVQANGHEIRAEFIFLCVNTGLPFFGHARYRQLTMYTYAGLSRELSSAEAAAFGSAADWGITPVERLEATSRKIGGRRFMLRAGFSYKRELPAEQVSQHLTGMMLARYPDMPGDLLEHVWGGAVSLTRNGEPVLGRVGEKLYVVSGCNASGILKMTMLGTLLVDGMAGVDSELLHQTRRFSHPTFIPPDPIRRFAVNMNIKKMQRQINANQQGKP